MTPKQYRESTTEGRKVAEDLLANWGRWCRDDTDRLLGYKRPIINAMYRPKRVDDRPPPPLIVHQDAEIANAAILHIRLREWPRDDLPPSGFTLYGLIVDRWAKGMMQKDIAKNLNCTTRTVRNRELRAIDEFWNEYCAIVRFLKKDVA